MRADPRAKHAVSIRGMTDGLNAYVVHWNTQRR